MLTRRGFLHRAGAAGVATLAGARGLFAAKYDLLIKGGRVLDPASEHPSTQLGVP